MAVIDDLFVEALPKTVSIGETVLIGDLTGD